MTAPLSLVRLRPAIVQAAAKVNLALHVVGRREDGYHLLSSLVAFAETGDELSISPSEVDGFRVTGPFAPALGLSDAPENLVVQALRLARKIGDRRGMDIGPLSITLDKRLPISSGIGGGSADAAALLAYVSAELPEIDAALREASLRLGADVPMCFSGVPTRAEGIGERLSPLAAFPAIACVLANPGVPVATPDVFRRLTRRDNAPLPDIPAGGFADAAALIDYLGATSNDLAGAAEEIVPEIATMRIRLTEAGATFARMSGSGATVFGLFGTDEEARGAAADLAARHPGCWAVATRLAAAPGKAPRE